MIIFFDPTRKYKFLVNHYFKIEKSYYQITGIDENLGWSQSTGSVTTLQETVKDWSDYLRPLDGYAYFIERMGINGRLGFAMQFPKGITHGAPRGQTRYLYYDDASHVDPIYYPFVVLPPHFPSWKLYNPTTATYTAYAYFFGEKWKIRKIPELEVNAEIEQKAIELTDYANSGIGQG